MNRYVYVYTYTYLHVTTTNGKRGHEPMESNEVYVEAFRMKKGKGGMMYFIIKSKIKEVF